MIYTRQIQRSKMYVEHHPESADVVEASMRTELIKQLAKTPAGCRRSFVFSPLQVITEQSLVTYKMTLIVDEL